jgi:hypothetical protein
MTRPIRIEFSGAFYHATSRGDRVVTVAKTFMKMMKTGFNSLMF